MTEINDIINEVKKIKLGQEEIIIDPKRLQINEASLSKYLEEEAVWYDYFGRKMADAEFLLQAKDNEYDVKYAEKFASHKESGCSDKLADANAKSDPEVEELKKSCIATKHKVKSLQQHLRAWDRNHDNAQSMGHNLRKEMDKFNSEIYLSSRRDSTDSSSDLLEDIIGST